MKAKYAYFSNQYNDIFQMNTKLLILLHYSIAIRNQNYYSTRNVVLQSVQEMKTYIHTHTKWEAPQILNIYKVFFLIF